MIILTMQIERMKRGANQVVTIVTSCIDILQNSAECSEKENKSV